MNFLTEDGQALAGAIFTYYPKTYSHFRCSARSALAPPPPPPPLHLALAPRLAPRPAPPPLPAASDCSCFCVQASSRRPQRLDDPRVAPPDAGRAGGVRRREGGDAAAARAAGGVGWHAVRMTQPIDAHQPTRIRGAPHPSPCRPLLHTLTAAPPPPPAGAPPAAPPPGIVGRALSAACSVGLTEPGGGGMSSGEAEIAIWCPEIAAWCC